MMQSVNNRIIIASAGSGKTTNLVNESLSRPKKKSAILTYTNNNLEEIKKKFYASHGGIPQNVTVISWFSFLLRDCARPYQKSIYLEKYGCSWHSLEIKISISSKEGRNWFLRIKFEKKLLGSEVRAIAMAMGSGYSLK